MRHDWEAAAVISDKLRIIVEELQILALASEGIPDGNPGGIDELYFRAELIADEWHDYSSKMDEATNETPPNSSS